MEHLDDRDVPQSHDSVGLLLLDHSFNPVYINSTARLVLTYAIGKDRVSVADIREMLRARMANVPDGESPDIDFWQAEVYLPQPYSGTRTADTGTRTLGDCF